MAAANPWKKGLFNCFDMGCDQLLCLLFCGACNYGKVMERLQIGGCVPCCLFGGLCACCNRGKIRQVYNIREDPNDILATFCCGLCANFQELQEIKIQENLRYGFMGNITSADGGPLAPPKRVFTR